eukprot:3963054-Amphidinium_carterae.1
MFDNLQGEVRDRKLAHRHLFPEVTSWQQLLLPVAALLSLAVCFSVCVRGLALGTWQRVSC